MGRQRGRGEGLVRNSHGSKGDTDKVFLRHVKGQSQKEEEREVSDRQRIRNEKWGGLERTNVSAEVKRRKFGK